MRKLMRVLFIFIFFTMLSSAAIASDAKVMELQNGFYGQLVNTKFELAVRYLVDTKTQMCFISFEGTSEIECKSLAKRPEWKSIITWAN